MKVSLDHLSKYFGDVKAVDNLCLDIEDGEFMALLGPSGCGKTTTLLTIAGFYKPTAGRILFDDKVVNEVPPRERNIGMVFQSYALYPHMTAFENIAFPLRLKKMKRTEIVKRVDEVADMLGIKSVLCRRPSELSGGQQQRVALARALVKQPSLLLLDEPLSNLDAKLRVTMRAELKRLQKDLKITTIFVTHDQIEAMTMADRIAILKDGRLQQVGTPDELYNWPQNVFVASFIGTPSMNFFKGTIEYYNDKCIIRTQYFCISLSQKKGICQVSSNTVIVGIRPEDVIIGKGDIKGNIYVVEPLGRETVVTIKIGEETLKAIAPPEFRATPGEEVNIGFILEKIRVFDAETETAVLAEREVANEN